MSICKVTHFYGEPGSNGKRKSFVKYGGLLDDVRPCKLRFGHILLRGFEGKRNLPQHLRDKYNLISENVAPVDLVIEGFEFLHDTLQQNFRLFLETIRDDGVQLKSRLIKSKHGIIANENPTDMVKLHKVILHLIKHCEKTTEKKTTEEKTKYDVLKQQLNLNDKGLMDFQRSLNVVKELRNRLVHPRIEDEDFTFDKRMPHSDVVELQTDSPRKVFLRHLEICLFLLMTSALHDTGTENMGTGTIINQSNDRNTSKSYSMALRPKR